MRIIPALAGNTVSNATRPPVVRDHPRACGEHSLMSVRRLLSQGSSPRLRGTRRRGPVDAFNRGIIPALAGNTLPSGGHLRRERDHPRACGEHRGRAHGAGHGGGSSPRLRGTLISVPFSVVCLGIIPALAGNTDGSAWCSRRTWDHPRACGEHELAVCTFNTLQGSSPRLRGTPPFVNRTFVWIGIIPALAGNTPLPASTRMALWDHPRACGEHTADGGTLVAQVGSSPRLRGTLSDQQQISGVGGIIPALAGNTLPLGSGSGVTGDHPRACGEHVGLNPLAPGRLGSSPRLRGTPFQCAYDCTSGGIIPALAGNTSCFFATLLVPWDHPRACGEHRIVEQTRDADGGSSPRLRGTHPQSRHAAPRRGIIPALAGNTWRGTSSCSGHGDHPRACGEHSNAFINPACVMGSSPRLRGTPVPHEQRLK